MGNAIGAMILGFGGVALALLWHAATLAGL